MPQESPFDTSQILEHQSEMNTIINQTADNLNEQKNAIADNLSTKKREILFAYSEQQRYSAYNKILLIIVAAIIISVGIYYANENFPLLPSIFITLIISIICSISIIWGYYIFLEVIRRSKNNYDELDLDRIDTFETIIKEGMSDQLKGQTIADLYDNMLNENKKTIQKTNKNVNRTKQNVNKTAQLKQKTDNNVSKTGENVNKTADNVNKSHRILSSTQAEGNEALHTAGLVTTDVKLFGEQLLDEAGKTINLANEKFDEANRELNEAKTVQEQTNANIVDIKKSVESANKLFDTDKQLQTFTTLKYAPYH